MFDLQKVGQGHSAIFIIRPFDGKCQNVQMTPTHFCASSYRFRDITILNCWPQKRRLRSWSAILANTPFNGKGQNLQMSPLHFCC